jgi:hypothetical protein
VATVAILVSETRNEATHLNGRQSAKPHESKETESVHFDQKTKPHRENPYALLILGVAFVSISFVIAIQAIRGLTSTGLAELTVENPVKDLGPTAQNQSLKTAFILTNKSSNQIDITAIKASCGCTTEKISESEILPGASTRLDVTVRTGVSRNNLRSQVTITYRGHKAEELKQLILEVRALVIADYEIEPMFLEFTEGNPKTTVIEIKSTNDTNFKVEEVVVSRKGFKTVIEKTTPNLTKIAVKFEPKTYDINGGVSELTIRTNNQNQPICTLPIKILKK